jgi:hypothetical protein
MSNGNVNAQLLSELHSERIDLTLATIRKDLCAPISSLNRKASKLLPRIRTLSFSPSLADGDKHEREDKILRELSSCLEVPESVEPIQQAGRLVVQRILQTYEAQLALLFNGRDYSEHKANYELPADERTAQLLKILNVWNDSMKPYVTRLWELQSLRASIKAQCPAIDHIRSDGRLVKSYAKKGLAALLLTVNFPAAILAWTVGAAGDSKERAECDQASIQFRRMARKYLAGLSELESRLQQSLDEACAYLRARYMQVNCAAVTAIVEDISASGRDVSYFFQYIQAERHRQMTAKSHPTNKRLTIAAKRPTKDAESRLTPKPKTVKGRRSSLHNKTKPPKKTAK